MANPTKITWVDPTTNADGSPITAGEVTGYLVGVRKAADPVGQYSITAKVTDPAAGSALISALSTVLVPGAYFVAIQTQGPIVSAFSDEVPFTIAAPVPPTPNPPSGLKVA